MKVMADVVAVAGRSSMNGDENVYLETYSHIDNGTASAKQT